MSASAEPGVGMGDWVDAGYIIRAHGVHGALRAALSNDGVGSTDDGAEDDLDAAWLSRCKHIRLIDRAGRAQICTLSTCRLIHGAVLMTCAEIVGREAAQLWAGATLQVPRDAVPTPQDGEAYVYELAGAKVQDMQARVLGLVHEVLDNAGQPLLVIATGDGTERLLPLVPETLHRVDREAKTLTVRVPQGLWDET